MAEFVVINDVGPRDGLQSQPRLLSPVQRLSLVRALLGAGLRHVEVGAFVSPRAVPAMAGADEILAGLPQDSGGLFTVLVPNLKGYELARAAGARSVCMVLYGSEGMARNNAHMSRMEAEVVTHEILVRARAEGVRVTATISASFVCPFDGRVDPAWVADLVARCMAAGADEVCVADTIGAADPGRVRALMGQLVAAHGQERLACHFHDTRALGLANVYAALEAGIRKFDSSIAGLGGCPFAPGASGNVATEDVAVLLQQMGFETGLDLPALVQAVDLAIDLTGTAPGGRCLPWLRGELGKLPR